jgi:hypothetical protein
MTNEDNRKRRNMGFKAPCWPPLAHEHFPGFIETVMTSTRFGEDSCKEKVFKMVVKVTYSLNPDVGWRI